MDTTQGTPVLRARALATVILSGLCILTAASALAGPLDASHRFERIGTGLSNTSAILSMPGEMRAVILQRSGEISLVCGDGLVTEPLTVIDVRNECPEKGLFSGVWAPDAVGQELYLTYVSGSTGFFTVGRLVFDDMGAPGDVEVVWQAASPAPCDNLGGGIAFKDDGTLLIGTGDFGNPAGAGQITQPVGKILRMTTDGLPPQPPLEANPFGAAPTYAMGVRNPVRMQTDPETGLTWFLDLGPGVNDELNLVRGSINFGWNQLLETGRNDDAGDPHHVWPAAGGALGLMPYNSNHFKADGKIMVAAADGIITEVRVNPPTPQDSDETILFSPDPDGPQSFQDLTVLPDGMIYVVDENGDLWRLTSATANPSEPGSASSVVPTLISKNVDGNLLVSAERSGSSNQFGLYVGDLMTLANGGYNHGTDVDGDGEPNETADFRQLDLNDASAWSTFELDSGTLFPDRGLPTPGADGREGVYILLSADASTLETGVGVDAFHAVRPGGNIIKSCRDCGGAPLGNLEGQCSDIFELDTYAIAGAGNVLGSTSFPLDWDCDVIQLSISAEWCGPCRFLASTAEEVYQTHKDDGFVIVDVMFENTAGAADDPGVVDRWAADFGLTHPVIHDDNRRVWNQYRNGGSIPQTWIIGCDGIITDWILGADPAAIEAAIERELSLNKCD